jgi:hypothetical protein
MEKCGKTWGNVANMRLSTLPPVLLDFYDWLAMALVWQLKSMKNH